MDLTRTIDELSTIYCMVPELRDVFVEGPADRAFYEWYLSKARCPGVSIYPISVVDVPTTLLDEHQMPHGSNRSRVIALAYELSRRVPQKGKVMCIVDRDSNDDVAALPVASFLYCTDGNALELYALTHTVIDKFLSVCCGGFSISSDELLRRILPILQRLYAMRMANKALGWGLRWIPFTTYVTVDGLSVGFREREFVRSYLQKGDRWDDRDRFDAELEKQAKTQDADVRRTVRGHDVTELLRHLLTKVAKTRHFGNQETLEGCLMTAIEASDLEHEPLFRTLRETYSAKGK